jgi:glycerophosphoryl diester phosphodiesterase
VADQFSAIQSGAKERTEGYGHFLTTWYWASPAG